MLKAKDNGIFSISDFERPLIFTAAVDSNKIKIPAYHLKYIPKRTTKCGVILGGRRIEAEITGNVLILPQKIKYMGPVEIVDYS
ncbi:MAG: hypothetical protein QW134_08950 [Nitrososphaeria archaeon]